MPTTSLIKDYPNYTIDTEGNVTNITTGKVLKPRNAGKGYKIIGLWKNGKSTNFYIHQLVATHFLPNPNNLTEINHRDENKQNNRLENLEWCTHKYNVNYGTNIERRVKNTDWKKVTTKRISNTDFKAIAAKKDMFEIGKKISRPIKCLETNKIYSGTREAERQTGIEHSSISKCCKGKLNTAGGYTWEYINNTEKNKEYAKTKSTS